MLCMMDNQSLKVVILAECDSKCREAQIMNVIKLHGLQSMTVGCKNALEETAGSK